MAEAACIQCGQIACPGAPRFKGICPHAKSDRQKTLEYFLQQRGVETPCHLCRGFGTIWYGSTSTWHGGMGGASMTQDVCHFCWGSGDEDNHWVDLKKLRNEENHRVLVAAADLFRQRCGFGMTVMNAGLEEMVKELEVMERQRRARPQGFDTIVRCLKKLLQDFVVASKAEEVARSATKLAKKT